MDTREGIIIKDRWYSLLRHSFKIWKYVKVYREVDKSTPILKQGTLYIMKIYECLLSWVSHGTKLNGKRQLQEDCVTPVFWLGRNLENQCLKCYLLLELKPQPLAPYCKIQNCNGDNIHLIYNTIDKVASLIFTGHLTTVALYCLISGFLCCISNSLFPNTASQTERIT